MKTRHTCLIFFFLCLTGMLCAQDTIFVMKQGKVQYFRALSDIDSISFVNTLDVRRSIVEKVALEPRFSLFYEALSATGMVDSLQMDQDRTYNPALYTYLISYPKSNPSDYWYQAVPSSRYFRHTENWEFSTWKNLKSMLNPYMMKCFQRMLGLRMLQTAKTV